MLFTNFDIFRYSCKIGHRMKKHGVENTSERFWYASKPNMVPVNIDESVGVSVEALSILGLKVARDKERLAEDLKNDFTELLNGQNRTGEPYVHLGLDNDYQLREMLEKIDGSEYNGKKYPKFYVWHQAPWTGIHDDFTHKLSDLVKRDKHRSHIEDMSGQSRLALNDGKNFMAPFIHLADMPNDKVNVKKVEKDEKTQLEALGIEKASYKLLNPRFNMYADEVSDYAMLTLVRRIKGEALQIPLGVWIIPNLGRKYILGGSAVSIVHTGPTGRIGLGWLRGDSSEGTGIGLSIGCNK